jgi:hypothetical protein
VKSKKTKMSKKIKAHQKKKIKETGKTTGKKIYMLSTVLVITKVSNNRGIA